MTTSPLVEVLQGHRSLTIRHLIVVSVVLGRSDIEKVEVEAIENVIMSGLEDDSTVVDVEAANIRDYIVWPTTQTYWYIGNRAVIFGN